MAYERNDRDVPSRGQEDDASDIAVDVVGGEASLSGYVDSRPAKCTAEDCTGGTQVQNNLRVGSATGQSPTGSASAPVTNRAKSARSQVKTFCRTGTHRGEPDRWRGICQIGWCRGLAGNSDSYALCQVI